MRRNTFLLATLLLACGSVGAQGLMGGHVTGNVQLDGQMSSADSSIGAGDVSEGLLLNARADILYTNGDFSAGLRFEAYQNPLLGFDAQWKGQGLAHYFVAYNGERLSVTAGHFYEQFGSGMTLRAYEDRYLGLDNALQGVSLTYRPTAGVTLKALAGRQRFYWDYADGVVRGVDAEVNLNSAFAALSESKLHVTLGASFVSKYEADQSISLPSDPSSTLNLPLNVGAGAARLDIAYGNWGLQAEYARKGQDPSVMNNWIYRPGEALMVNATYAQRGFSANLQAKHVDNMSFKSARNQSGEMLYINYIPAINKQHTYALMAMYPYATQVTGENGLQGDVMYKIKKGTLLGGKYGTDVHLNSSVITALDTTRLGDAGTEGYDASWFGIGKLYYGDASVEVAKKFSKTVKVTLTYAYQVFNPVVEGHASDLYHNNIVVADVSWKASQKHSLRFEAEWLGSDSRYAPLEGRDDRRAGDWLMGLVEWNIGRHWFLSLSDQYAYHDGTGNYPSLAAGYTRGATRLQVSYGKQREGLLCVGGVCRQVPASNGLSFSLTTSF